MAKKSRDWYWQAECDKIAADEDLRLLPSPEGWPSEGLDSIGLWFLMVNLMWRSRRTGYLHDPNDERLPLDSTKLAKLLGRDPTVVARIVTVLLARGLFSKTPEGIIYSRGILNRVKLREKRSKAGKKGGLRSQDLLKQKVEQKGEQTLTIALAMDLDSSSSLEGDARGNQDHIARLAQKAAMLSGKGTKPSAVADWHAHISDLLAAGFSLEIIESDLDQTKGPRGKLKSEPPWEFRKRLEKQHGVDSPLANDGFGCPPPSVTQS